MKLTANKVMKLVSFWMKEMEFEEQWEIGIKINADPSEEKKRLRNAAAYVRVEAGYFIAYLTINAFNIDSEKHLEEVIIHELVHILLWPIRQVVFSSLGENLEPTARALDETATERLSRIIYRLRSKRKAA